MRPEDELIKKLGSSLDSGLTSSQASELRERQGLNIVKPPLDCPAWACVVLPCLNHLPSMKAFKSIQPDDAEVLRGGKWIRYDATSLVVGDVIRLEEGDMVPADVAVVELTDELLVDALVITGQESLHTISSTMQDLYWGSHLVQGSCKAVVTAIGSQTRASRLIQSKNFPARTGTIEDDGIALVGVSS